MTAWMWLLVVLAGAAALGAFILYGQEKTEEPEPIEADRRREAATRETYRKAEEGKD
jgi:hypothetical protein